MPTVGSESSFAEVLYGSGRWCVLQGHVLDVLKSMPDECIQTVVTSPPYWGLRDYKLEPQVWGGEGCEHEWGAKLPPRPGRGNAPGDYSTSSLTNPDRQDELPRPQDAGSFCLRCSAWKGSLGLEPTPDLYVQHLVEIFREVRRVLRSDGTLWLNMGDAYAGSGYSNHKNTGGARREDGGKQLHTKSSVFGLKPKDLLGMPWRVAFAFQADGWYLRSDTIWAKPNAMPESVRDRPTKTHEYLFLFAKNQRYFYDTEAITEDAAPQSLARIWQKTFHQQTGGPKDYGTTGVNPNRSMRKTLENFAKNPRRNKRSVWWIPTRPFKGAHFAVFPPALVEPCVLAGTSEKGCCPECGAPWERVTEDGQARKVRWAPGPDKHTIAVGGKGATSVMHTGVITEKVTVGWRPTCTHGTEHPIPHDELAADPTLLDSFEIKPHAPIPCVVLDPFVGSGAAGVVALKHGRRFIGIELSPEYVRMAEGRIRAGK